VRNILKYYVAYKLTMEAHDATKGAREQLEPPKPPPAKKPAAKKPAAKKPPAKATSKADV